MKFPDEWIEILKDTSCGVAAFLHNDKPLFIIKSSHRINARTAKLHFDTIMVNDSSPIEFPASIKIAVYSPFATLWRTCKFDINNHLDRDIFVKLTNTSYVSIAFILDDNQLTFISMKSFSWNLNNQKRAQSILKRHSNYIKAQSSNKKHIPKTITTQNTKKSTPPLPTASQQKHSDQSSTFMQPHDPKPDVTPTSKSFPTDNQLLIEHYIDKHGKKAVTIEQSHKYLWMNDAWIMAEALRLTDDNTPLRLPTEPIYIELEQPRPLHRYTVAAFSFLPQDAQYWMFHAINNEGQTLWSAFYEKGSWTLPNNFICPNQACTTEEVEGVIFYTLCNLCQERITHFTSWLTIALRMIAGDFQEQIEMREPETTVELSRSGKKHTLHRFRIVRYHDACKRKGKGTQTKRGSWMTNRPLADSEYEVNPNAIIYVKIYPKEHNRTYRHQRYTHMQGKTQHIDPHPRLQPMTIAAYQQRKQIQRITKVTASKFKEEKETP